MPLIKYFVVVGSALILSLVGIGWWRPQPPAPNSLSDGEERPTIRITSVEHPPERVVIDTSLPTIVPPPSGNFAPPTIVVEPSQQPLQDAFAGLTVEPQSDTSRGTVEVAKAKHVMKREPAKKVVAHRTAPPLNIGPAPTYSAQQSTPSTRMSFLETLRERLGRALFKLN
jgi:hypothetical protein